MPPELLALLANVATPNLPDNFNALSDDELEQLCNALAELLAERGRELEGDPVAAAATVASTGRLVDAMGNVLDEIERRPKLVRRAANAATTRAAAVRRPASTQPRPTTFGPGGFVAATTGHFLTVAEVGDALAAAANDVQPGGRVTVARVPIAASMPRVTGDWTADAETIKNAQQALVAAGGICSPPMPLHSVRTVTSERRPIRDALVPIAALRGSVTFTRAITLADAAAGVGVWTNADDIAGSSTKAVLDVVCGDWETVTVQAITQRLRLGNFQLRYFGEGVQAHIELLAAAHSRLAETSLVAGIDAAKTATVDTGQLLGTARDVLATVDRLASQIRTRARTADGALVTLIAPEFVRASMRVDLTRQMPGDDELATTDQEIDALFRVRGVSVVWTPDLQVPGPQGDGPLQGWPSTAVCYAFLTGSVAFVDGGSLDLGLVRDSVLNATNNAELFSETMEAVAFLGGGDLVRLTADLCPDGSASELVAVDPCATGS